MKSLFLSMPCAVVAGLLITRLLLEVLQISDSLAWNALGTLVFTGLLFRRQLYEFALIAVLLALSRADPVAGSVVGLAGDAWLSVVLAVVVLPVLVRILGISWR